MPKLYTNFEEGLSRARGNYEEETRSLIKFLLITA